MKLVINGEERSLANVSSLTSLLKELGLKADRVAVELNRQIVPRGSWESTSLKEGDCLEIVQFVGGGSSADGGRDSVAILKLRTMVGFATLGNNGDAKLFMRWLRLR